MVDYKNELIAEEIKAIKKGKPSFVPCKYKETLLQLCHNIGIKVVYQDMYDKKYDYRYVLIRKR